MNKPKREQTITADELQILDDLYAQRNPSGRPGSWGSLVENLREIRRTVEAGTIVIVEDNVRLHSWNSFYTWAHGRYHMLEDGYDSWIGDDNS